MPYEIPDENNNKTFKKRGGRPGELREMSPQMVRAKADDLLTVGLSEHAWNVIELLAQSGVLSAEQLRFLVAPSTLARQYKVNRMVDKLPFTNAELAAALEAHGLAFTEKTTRLYVLGPVGVELARLRTGNTPVGGYLAYTLNRVMHDVMLNEVVLRFSRFAKEQGWSVLLSGANEGALYNADYSHKILEPDAFLTLQKDGEDPRHFCIEYHNEDHRTRAERKVDKYELVCRNNARIWQTVWETDTFPRVLAVFKNRIVGEGYRDKLQEEPGEVQFYGKLLAGILQDNLAEWVNFTAGKREALLE